MVTKTYNLFDNMRINIPWYGARETVSLAKNITWDSKTTEITSAKIRLTVKPSRGYVKAYVELNYIEAGRFTWALLDSELQSEQFDIIGTIVNGSNFISVTVAKDFGNVDPVVFIISADIVLTYEGDEPEEGTDWIEYLKIGAAGLGVTAGFITIASSLERREKK